MLHLPKDESDVAGEMIATTNQEKNSQADDSPSVSRNAAPPKCVYVYVSRVLTRNGYLVCMDEQIKR